MTTAVAPLGSIAKLATLAARLVRDTPAPEPASVTLYPESFSISVQPAHTYDPVATIGALLIWTHRLTRLHADWWHTATGDLHITVVGRGPCGTRVHVYSSFAYRLARPHVLLHKGDTESVTPDELYRLAVELRTEKGHTS
ncbi:MAG: hypothetical protein JWQ81_6071 [Amycolatopsis sp.]|uniref:hypothetical protein n=1 Tax=Amycolatopsis sp. TaxID=37632 RepID=UPI00261D4E4D|nr:hypothetical protein [Amycolatopsis sp.]MCU1685332.1 hypothetical protein [Amycolatopsis sp.]